VSRKPGIYTFKRYRFRREVAAARTVSGAFTAPVIDADPDALFNLQDNAAARAVASSLGPPR